jgi:hypothetical protein
MPDETPGDGTGTPPPSTTPPVHPNTPPNAMIDPKALLVALRDLGLAPAVPPAVAAPSSPAVATPPATTPNPIGDGVVLTKAEYDAFLGLKQEREDAEAKAKKAAEDLAIKQGDFKTVLEARDRTIAESATQREGEKNRARSAFRDSQLAMALAGKNLVPGGVEQLVHLWRDDFETHADGADRYRVTSKDHRDVAMVVAERLASDTFNHFLMPTSRGGGGAPSGGQQTTPTSPAVVTPAPQAQNLGQAIISVFNDQQKNRNGSRPIGLRARP